MRPWWILGGLLLAAAPPAGDFSFVPEVPVAGRPVAFTATVRDPEDGPLGYAWDLDGDGQAKEGAGPSVHWTYPIAGVRRVRVDVTDAEGITASITRPVAVDAPPTAAPSWTPATPTVDDLVTLRAGEADPDGTVAAVAWDTDGDGVFDDPPTLRFPRPGTFPVAARVTDDRGVDVVAPVVVEVLNRPPFAAFGFVPAAPLRGRRVVFRSTSADPDHGAVALAWDLDGDGAFDDGAGLRATARFRAAGARRIGLQVTDEQGATATAFVMVTVSRRAAPSLSPFPVVRLAGRSSPGAIRVRRLAISQAPAGARVQVSCRGRGCPVGIPQVVVRSARRPVRVRAMEGRRLSRGAVVVVRVSAERRTGKYVSFRVRRRNGPRRTDRCLEPGGRAPVRCPG